MAPGKSSARPSREFSIRSDFGGRSSFGFDHTLFNCGSSTESAIGDCPQGEAEDVVEVLGGVVGARKDVDEVADTVEDCTQSQHLLGSIGDLEFAYFGRRFSNQSFLPPRRLPISLMLALRRRAYILNWQSVQLAVYHKHAT